MIESIFRGHTIIFKDGQWFYKDTDSPTATTYKKRPCGRCNKFPTKEGHDACIGTLPNVMNACCGHGNIQDAYIQFWDGTDIRGQEAQKYIRKRGK